MQHTAPHSGETHKSASTGGPKHASTGLGSSAPDLCQACGKPHKLEECPRVRHEVRRDHHGLSSDGEDDKSFNEVRLRSLHNTLL
jgi:hypothetical protein